MAKHNNIFRIFPFYFFIFLCLFIFIKFVFIFFFRAAFEPRFIFELTPFYIFAGVTNLQLIFLSLAIVGFDTFLHIKATQKNLRYSFIPTIIMICGLGLGITTKEISISSLPHYLLFGLLLVVILMDHRCALLYPETLIPAEPAKPEPLPAAATVQRPLAARKPRLSFSAISSIFSIFKRGKKTAESEEKSETSKMTEPISAETVKEEEETVKIDELMTKSTKEDISVEPEIKSEISEEAAKPEPSEAEEPPAPTGGGGGLPQFVEAKEDIETYKSDSYKFSPTSQYKKDEIGTGFPIKDTIAQPLGPSKVEEKDKHKEILETVEKIYPQKERSAGEQIELKKEKIGITIEKEKPVIPKGELERLKQKIADRKKDIENKTTVIQDAKSGFENIQVGLDSLKNKLENLGGEIQSTFQELGASRRKQEERRRVIMEEKPLSHLADSRKTARMKILEPPIVVHKQRLYDKRRSDLKRAQSILKKLQRKVEKLEQIHIYQID